MLAVCCQKFFSPSVWNTHSWPFTSCTPWFIFQLTKCCCTFWKCGQLEVVYHYCLTRWKDARYSKKLLCHGTNCFLMTLCRMLYAQFFFPDLRFTVPYYMLETLPCLELNKMVSLWNRPCAQCSWYKSVCFHNTPAGLAPGCYLAMLPCCLWNKYLKWCLGLKESNQLHPSPSSSHLHLLFS